MATTCGACNRPCRTTSLALVAQPDGGITRKRVCNDCFGGALHIVPNVTQVHKGVDESKIQRRDAAEVTKAACKKLRTTATAYRGAHVGRPENEVLHSEGRAAGLEQAADILEAGDY